MSLSTALAELIERAGPRAQVLVEEPSLRARDLSSDDLLTGVRAVTRGDIARAMVACDRTLLFWERVWLRSSSPWRARPRRRPRATLGRLLDRGARCVALRDDLVLRGVGAGEHASTVDHAGMIALLAADHDRVLGAF